MKLKISEEIIQQTTKCDRDFACLKPDDKPSCSIKDCVSQKVHFVAKHNRYCRYSFRFGNEIICSCPVRKELYNRFKV